MLLMMLERGEPIHSVVFFDTQWEFPEMYDHIDKLEAYTGVKVWRLQSALPFDYWLSERPIRNQKTGKIQRIGNGWPHHSRRWCTRIKAQTIDRYCNAIEDCVSCIGYSAEEEHRAQSMNLQTLKRAVRFPLIEWGVSEKDALAYCYKHGFDWGGLYEHFSRVSCFCCPLQRMSAVKALWQHYPDLWQRILDMDASIPVNRGFIGEKTVSDLDRQFKHNTSLSQYMKEAV